MEPLYNYTIGTSNLVLLIEVSFVEGSFNIIKYQNGTRKVSLVVRCPLFRGVLYKGLHCTCIVHITTTNNNNKTNNNNNKLVNYRVIISVKLRSTVTFCHHNGQRYSRHGDNVLQTHNNCEYSSREGRGNCVNSIRSNVDRKLILRVKNKKVNYYNHYLK